MVLCGGRTLETGLCHCLTSGDLPGTRPVSSHFTHFPNMTGSLLAVALVVNPRVGALENILNLCRPFQWTLLKIWQFLPPPQPPLFFIARSYRDISSLHWNPGLCGLAWEWDCSLSRYPSWFSPTTCECGTAHSTTASLHNTTSPCLSTCLCDSAPPTHLDEWGFFKCFVVGFP